MTQATNLEEYTRLAHERAKVSGLGVDTSMTLPCFFCAAEDFVTYKILEMEKVMSEPHKCKECGRSAKLIFEQLPSGVSFECVQTGGPEQPDWLEPKMRRLA